MSSLQQKLLNCEVPPPGGAWDKITASLDEEPVAEKEDYAARLYELEITPPASHWQFIESLLDEKNGQMAPVKKMSFFRYAAAAVIIAALGIWIFRLVSPDKTAGIAGNNDTASIQSPVVAPLKIPATADTPKDLAPLKNEAPVDYAKLDQIGRSNMKKALARTHYTASAIDAVHPVYAYEDHVPNLADRYVMLMTPEGNIIRMSKKLGSLICCVSGEEQDGDCKDQLKKWQEKMAMSTLAPSPGNFLDILSLVNSLEDAEL